MLIYPHKTCRAAIDASSDIALVSGDFQNDVRGNGSKVGEIIRLFEDIGSIPGAGDLSFNDETAHGAFHLQVFDPIFAQSQHRSADVVTESPGTRK